MPYYRRPYRRYPVRRPRPGYSRYRKKQFVKRVQHVITKTAEKKFYPVSQLPTAVSEAGILWSLSSVPQGTTDVTREGDQLRLRSIEFNYQCIVADTTNTMRVIVFIYKPPAIPTVTDILQGPVSTAVAPLSPYNHDNRYNYQVLHDRLYQLDSVTQLVTKKLKIWKIPNILRKVQYVAGSITLNMNGVYVLAISDSAAVTHPTFGFHSKVNFSDT